MKKRSIILFPKLKNKKIIQSIRAIHDPLYNKIEPHITIVFPFESDLTSEELRKHICNNTKGISLFEVSFNSFSGSFIEGYIFLDCVKGNDEIIRLHDSLYTDILAKYIFNETPYFPHITVGKLNNKDYFSNVLADMNKNYMNIMFSCTIESIFVETIDEFDNSNIELEILLNH